MNRSIMKRLLCFTFFFLLFAPFNAIPHRQLNNNATSNIDITTDLQKHELKRCAFSVRPYPIATDPVRGLQQGPWPREYRSRDRTDQIDIFSVACAADGTTTPGTITFCFEYVTIGQPREGIPKLMSRRARNFGALNDLYRPFRDAVAL